MAWQMHCNALHARCMPMSQLSSQNFLTDLTFICDSCCGRAAVSKIKYTNQAAPYYVQKISGTGRHRQNSKRYKGRAVEIWKGKRYKHQAVQKSSDAKSTLYSKSTLQKIALTEIRRYTKPTIRNPSGAKKQCYKKTPMQNWSCAKSKPCKHQAVQGWAPQEIQQKSIKICICSCM